MRVSIRFSPTAFILISSFFDLPRLASFHVVLFVLPLELTAYYPLQTQKCSLSLSLYSSVLSSRLPISALIHPALLVFELNSPPPQLSFHSSSDLHILAHQIKARENKSCSFDGSVAALYVCRESKSSPFFPEDFELWRSSSLACLKKFDPRFELHVLKRFLGFCTLSVASTDQPKNCNTKKEGKKLGKQEKYVEKVWKCMNNSH